MQSSAPVLFFLLPFLAVGCLSSSDSGGDSAAEEPAVTPLEGRWEFFGTGWQDDECNGTENVSEPTAFISSDVEEGSFKMKVYENASLVGQEVSCELGEEDTYTCGVITQEWSVSTSTTIYLEASTTMSFSDEGSAAGQTVLELDCQGSDCAEAAATGNSGVFPCNSTWTWSAGFVE